MMSPSSICNYCDQDKLSAARAHSCDECSPSFPLEPSSSANNNFLTQVTFIVTITTHADGRHGEGFSVAFVSLSVFPRNISKTAAARITKIDTDMDHHDSWKRKPIYFGVKRSTVKVTKHKNSVGVRCGFMHSFDCRILLVVIKEKKGRVII